MATGVASLTFEEKLAVANRVLSTFSICSIQRLRGGFYVTWTMLGKTTGKRWVTRGQDFYPMWRFPQGGTCCTAVSQLIRWLRGQPVLPIASWRYWASEKCKLVPPEQIDVLLEAGYPERAECVLCQQLIEGSHDWWSLDGVSGPCCCWTKGCRQQVKK